MSASSTRRRERVAFALFYTVVLALGVGLGIRTIVDGYSPVPYGDLWGLLAFVERGLQGDFGISDLWAQWNEHRLFLARIQFLVDYRFFDGTNVYLFVWIATSCLLLAGTFAAAVWFETRDWLLTLGALAVAGTSALPLAGLENLTLGVQVQFVQVFLWSAVSILSVVMAARSTLASRQAIGAGVAAVAAIAATYSLANGLLAWVVLVVLAVLLGLDRRCTAALVIVGLATTATYMWHFELTGERSLSDPVGLVHYVVLYLGAAPTPNAGSAAIAGTAGLVLLLVLCRLAWTERRGPSILVPFGAGVSAFIALTAAQTATGRLDLGVDQALTSRYSIASYTFWLGLFVGFLPAVRVRLRSLPWGVPAYLGGAAGFALVISYAALPSSPELRSFVAGRQATVVAYRSGVEDVFASPVPGLQFGPGVTSALRFLEREKLGPWAPGGMVDEMRVTGPGDRTDRACLGQLDSQASVPGGTRLLGWIAARDGETTSRHLVVLDDAGRRVGLGLVGLRRPVDQPGIADPAWSGFIAYARGQPTSPLEVVLLDENGVNAVCSLRATVAG